MLCIDTHTHTEVYLPQKSHLQAFPLKTPIKERSWVLPLHPRPVALAVFPHQVSKALREKRGISFSLF